MSEQSQAEPRRLELTWSDGSYRVSVPNLLDDKERIKLREDRATEADIRATAKHLAARDLGAGDPDTIVNICEGYLDEARCQLATVFSEVADA